MQAYYMEGKHNKPSAENTTHSLCNHAYVIAPLLCPVVGSATYNSVLHSYTAKSVK